MVSRRIRQDDALKKKMKKGFRGYPVATVAFYGPDSKRASKVAVGIINGEDQEPAAMERWHSDNLDVRLDKNIGKEILLFIKEHNARTVVATDGIIGCPHEEGVDYPHGEACPQCPYWANRDRFLDEVVH